MSRDFEPFCEYLIQLGRSERSIAGYLIDLRTFATWFEQTNGYLLAPDNLTPTDVQEYRQFLLNVRKAKASTINRHLAALRAYGHWAKSCGSVPYNPVEGIKSIAQQKHAPKWLDRREQAAVLWKKAISSTQCKPFSMPQWLRLLVRKRLAVQSGLAM